MQVKMFNKGDKGVGKKMGLRELNELGPLSLPVFESYSRPGQ